MFLFYLIIAKENTCLSFLVHLKIVIIEDVALVLLLGDFVK